MVIRWSLPIGLAIACLIGAGVMVNQGRSRRAVVPVNPADGLRREADRVFTTEPAKAKVSYEKIVHAHAKSVEPADQDRVGNARIRLGYLSAKAKDFTAARSQFLLAAKTKGTGAMGAAFGGISDQAAYQAAVCLVAQGQTEAARAEFRRFMKEQQLSPLTHAAFKRLVRLNGGEPDPGDEALLQASIGAQEKRIRFETSVCGPKVIEHILPLLGKPAVPYQRLAKLCGTTDAGTTLAGMRKGLQAMGLEGAGIRLNRQDLARLKSPAILLQQDHYVALLEVGERSMRVYDPRYKSELRVPLPALDDPDFTATVIVFETPKLNQDLQ
jgi:hypothetical protein